MELSQTNEATWTADSLERFSAMMWRVPLVTLLLAAVALLFQFSVGVGERMALDRGLIADGDYWRLATGHLTHWNIDHLVWDLLMFVILGAMIERRSPAALVALLVGATAAIDAALWFGHIGVSEYRGLSGNDSALFALAVLLLYDDARSARQRIAVWGLMAMAAGFAGKVIWESVSGATIFVDSSAAGFTPLPLVHLVGACVGVLVWFGMKAGNRDSDGQSA